MVAPIYITTATAQDIPSLYSYLPTVIPGLYEEKIINKATVLLAIKKVPIGRIIIEWEGNQHALVQQHATKTPNLSSLLVKTQERNNGIGTQLLLTAEHIIQARGYRKLGLSLDVTNTYAKRFYEKRGYVVWQHGVYIRILTFSHLSGTTITKQSTRTYMIKDIGN